MKTRLLSKEDFYAEGLIVVGKMNLKVGDNTHAELDDNDCIIGICKVEKPKAPTRKPRKKKEES